METYHGHVRTPNDAIILFEACRIGLLPRVQRRLSEKERQSIKSGSVFVWDEREAGMRRWTDGKSWSASRVSGSFLTYREMEGKRGANSVTPVPQPKRPSGKSPDGSATGDSDGELDGYRYKVDGLSKQSFSITTAGGQHLHLISYLARQDSSAHGLQQPSNDPSLRHIRPPKNMYPESTVNETATTPPVTRGPMAGSPFTSAPHQMAPSSPYSRPGTTPAFFSPQPAYPMTPHATPPMQYAFYPPGVGVQAVGYQPVYVHAAPYGHHPAGLMNGVPAALHHAPHPHHHPQAYMNHPSYAHPAYGAPPARPPIHEIPQQPPPPPSAPSASRPSEGLQLPALNNIPAAPPRIDKPTTPQDSEPKSQETLSATASDTAVPSTSGAAPARTIPSVGALLNGHPSDATQSTSRSGSRSPSNAQRLQELPSLRPNDTRQTDAHAIKKLDGAMFSATRT